MTKPDALNDEREAFEAWATNDPDAISLSCPPQTYADKYWLRMAKRAYVAGRASVKPAIPQGFQLVPIEPTHEMLNASYYPKVRAAMRAEIYTAMLKAATTPPKKEIL